LISSINHDAEVDGKTSNSPISRTTQRIKHPTCTVVPLRTRQFQWFLCHSYWELLAVFILNTEKCIVRSNRTSSGQHSTSSAP